MQNNSFIKKRRRKRVKTQNHRSSKRTVLLSVLAILIGFLGIISLIYFTGSGFQNVFSFEDNLGKEEIEVMKIKAVDEFESRNYPLAFKYYSILSQESPDPVFLKRKAESFDYLSCRMCDAIC